jgi:hypothetical protein
MNIITGMHRSGTSLVASLLYELGANFGEPQNLMEKDQWNAQGYFEDVHTVSINDALILSDYDRARGYFAGKARARSRIRPLWILRQFAAKARYLLPINFMQIHRRAERMRGEMERLGREREGIWVKDPRFCLTLREWLEQVLDKPRVIISYRHPEEVAGSLARRDRCPPIIGRRLWREHNARILRTCNDYGLQPSVVSFRNFFSEDQALDEMRLLFHALEQPWDEHRASAALQNRVRSTLRHHRAGSPQARSGEASLYALLRDRREKMLEQIRAAAH